jgi:hypothetical protein
MDGPRRSTLDSCSDAAQRLARPPQRFGEAASGDEPHATGESRARIMFGYAGSNNRHLEWLACAERCCASCMRCLSGVPAVVARIHVGAAARSLADLAAVARHLAGRPVTVTLVSSMGCPSRCWSRNRGTARFWCWAAEGTERGDGSLTSGRFAGSRCLPSDLDSPARRGCGDSGQSDRPASTSSYAASKAAMPFSSRV